MSSFEVEAVVQGYHVYKEIWTPSIGEELIFAREPAKPRDPFAVAVVKSNQAVKIMWTCACAWPGGSNFS